MKYFAGIGSRQTPEPVLKAMTLFGRAFTNIGYVLRSGGADGADNAFSKMVHKSKKQIFLPWDKFNGVESNFNTPADWAFPIAEKYHPSWDTLSQGAQKLMARNVHQVLGYEENDIVTSFIICWTPDGKASGGTGQAMRIARDKDIPIYNLATEKDIDNLKELYSFEKKIYSGCFE